MTPAPPLTPRPCGSARNYISHLLFRQARLRTGTYSKFLGIRCLNHDFRDLQMDKIAGDGPALKRSDLFSRLDGRIAVTQKLVMQAPTSKAEKLAVDTCPLFSQ